MLPPATLWACPGWAPLPHAAPEALLHSCSPPRRFQPSGPGWHRGARQPARCCLHRASPHCGYASGSSGVGWGWGSAHQLQDPTASLPLFTGPSNLYHPPNLEKEVFPGPPAGTGLPTLMAPGSGLGEAGPSCLHHGLRGSSKQDSCPCFPKGLQTKVCARLTGLLLLALRVPQAQAHVHRPPGLGSPISFPLPCRRL